jgi:hypothetical protein
LIRSTSDMFDSSRDLFLTIITPLFSVTIA